MKEPEKYTEIHKPVSQELHDELEAILDGKKPESYEVIRIKNLVQLNLHRGCFLRTDGQWAKVTTKISAEWKAWRKLPAYYTYCPYDLGKVKTPNEAVGKIYAIKTPGELTWTKFAKALRPFVKKHGCAFLEGSFFLERVNGDMKWPDDIWWEKTQFIKVEYCNGHIVPYKNR